MDSALFWIRNTIAARKSIRPMVFELLRGCAKFEFKRTVYGFSLPSKNLLLENGHFLSGLCIVVKVRSSQIVDSDKLNYLRIPASSM